MLYFFFKKKADCYASLEENSALQEHLSTQRDVTGIAQSINHVVMLHV